MKTCLKGYLYPDLLFVDAPQLNTLRIQLEWLGWQVSDQLRIIPFGGVAARHL